MALWSGGNRSDTGRGLPRCLSFTFVWEVKNVTAWARYSYWDVPFLDTASIMPVI